MPIFGSSSLRSLMEGLAPVGGSAAANASAGGSSGFEDASVQAGGAQVYDETGAPEIIPYDQLTETAQATAGGYAEPAPAQASVVAFAEPGPGQIAIPDGGDFAYPVAELPAAGPEADMVGFGADAVAEGYADIVPFGEVPGAEFGSSSAGDANLRAERTPGTGGQLAGGEAYGVSDEGLAGQAEAESYAMQRADAVEGTPARKQQEFSNALNEYTFSKVIQERQPDLTDDQALLVARARIEAAGNGGVREAAQVFADAYGALEGTTWGSIFLESLVMMGAGAPIGGAGRVAALVGRGQLSPLRYAALSVAGDVGGVLGAQGAQSVGLPAILGMLAGGYAGGTAVSAGGAAGKRLRSAFAVEPSDLEKQLEASIKAASAKKVDQVTKLAEDGVGAVPKVNAPKPKPKGNVTKGDGSTVPANVDEIQAGIRRLANRGGPKTAGLTLPITANSTPQEIADAIYNVVSKAKTGPKGGFMFQGVDEIGLKQALADMADELEVSHYATGSRGRYALRLREGGARQIPRSKLSRPPTTEEARLATPAEIARMEAAAQDAGDLAAAWKPGDPIAKGAGQGGPPDRPKLDVVEGSGKGEDWIRKFIQYGPERLGNELRQATAGFDFSNALRQGWGSIRHGTEFLSALGDGAKGAFNREFALARNAALKAGKGAQHGLYIADIPDEFGSTAQKLSRREENYAGDLMSRMPGYRETGRGNTLGLNSLRNGVYNVVDNAWTRAEKAVEAGNPGPFQRLTTALSRPGDRGALANYINRTTGRGTLGPIENTWLGDILGIGFFSPRYQASRIEGPLQMLNWKHPRVAVEAVKDYGASFAATASLLALANESGLARVEMNPLSSDFGKFKDGALRIDPWAGYQQLATFTSRMLAGHYESGYDPGAVKMIGSFLRGKLAPGPGMIANFLPPEVGGGGGEDVTGRKVNWSEAALSFIPIFAQGMYEAARDGLLGQAIASAPANFFGLGVNLYETNDDISEQLGYKGFYQDLDPLAQIEVLREKESRGYDISSRERSGPYWSARDLAVERLQADLQSGPFREIATQYPEVASILMSADSYGDLEDAIMDSMKSYGMSKAEAEKGAQQILDALLGNRIKEIRGIAIKADPRIVQAVEDQGYSVSKELKSIAAASGVR